MTKVLDNWMDLVRINLTNSTLLQDDYRSMNPEDIRLPIAKYAVDRKRSKCETTRNDLISFFDGRYRSGTFRLNELSDMDASNRKFRAYIGDIYPAFELRSERDVKRLIRVLKAAVYVEIDREFNIDKSTEGLTLERELRTVAQRLLSLLDDTLINTIKMCDDEWWKRG